MNYFEHHIGDYAEATSHLSLLEDAVYSRLIRKYYATEQPIPADTKRVQRLVGARSPDEIEALQVVLEEFFVLEDDGWHNARCDREIGAFNAGQPERDLKKRNEANRLRRHRDERAALFRVITEAGEHADWNTKTGDLRELAQRLTARSGAKPATAPATAPATPDTATQSPVPSTQYPVSVSACEQVGEQPGPVGPTHHTGLVADQPDAGSGSQADGAQALAAAAAAAAAMRTAGLPDVSATHPKFRALVSAGLSPAELADAAVYAASKGQGFPYALARAEGRRRDAVALAAGMPSAGSVAPVPGVVDPDSRGGIEASARELGLPGWNQSAEQWPQFAARVRKARKAVGVAA